MIQMRVKEYQLADNTVTFNYHHSFKIRPEYVRPNALLFNIVLDQDCCTVFEGNMLHWYFKIIRDPFDSPWILQLLQSESREKCPPAKKIQITLNVMETDGSVNQSIKYVIDGQTNEGRTTMESGIIRTDPNSKFGKDLSKLMAIAEKKEQQVELETQWVFDRDDFADLKYLLDEGAPIESDNSENTSNAMTKTSFFDFLRFFRFKTFSPQNLKLFTSDGTQFVMTNKETASRASEYFRGLLNEHTTELTVDSSDVEVINICLIYMATGRFKKPAELTLRMASEIYALAEQWYLDSDKLRNSLEKHLCQELKKNYEDLPYVCNLMIIAEDAKFYNVQWCCIATIVSYHACDFLRTMVHTSHPLSERLSNPGGFQHVSLAEKVTDAYYQSLKAKPCINVISDD